MAQHDFNINNQSAPAFRGDLNNALEALVTLSSGATAPATTYANMLWYDTSNNILKMRSESDDAWIALGTLDQSTNTFTPAGVPDLTQVQVEDDTSTVFGKVSGQRLAQVSTKYIAAAEVTRNTAASTVNPSGFSEVVFSSLSEPFYQFYFNGIYPASSDANVELYAYMSGDNGSTWTFVGDTGSANWRLNGGGSGVFLLNTLVGVGQYALGYKNAITSKVGRFIAPTGATLPINAVRFRWRDTDPGSFVNFGTDVGQTITQYVR